VKAGRTLTLVQAEVFSESEGRERLIAFLTATMMTVEGRGGIIDLMTSLYLSNYPCGFLHSCTAFAHTTRF
jgi:hypothetical protein